MARPLRPQIAGGLYHIMCRGNHRAPIYIDTRDGQMFISILADVIKRHSWYCHSYCLMPNHYHLLIETPNADIASGMHRLNNRFAKWFNVRREQTGHLFECRYRSVIIETDEQFLELVRYIALNPVRALLCERAEMWRWSSYGALVGVRARNSLLTTRRVMTAFAIDPGSGRGANPDVRRRRPAENRLLYGLSRKTETSFPVPGTGRCPRGTS